MGIGVIYAFFIQSCVLDMNFRINYDGVENKNRDNKLVFPGRREAVLCAA